MNINKKCIIGLLGLVITSPIVMKSEEGNALSLGRAFGRVFSGVRGIFGATTTSTSSLGRVRLEPLKPESASFCSLEIENNNVTSRVTFSSYVLSAEYDKKKLSSPRVVLKDPSDLRPILKNLNTYF